VRQMLRMAGRKTIMAAWHDVQQFIERISVRQPRRSLLLGAEKVAQVIESDRNWKADAGYQLLFARKVGRNLIDRAARRIQVVMTYALFIQSVRVRICQPDTESKINIVLFVQSDPERIDIVKSLAPAGRHSDLL